MTTSRGRIALAMVALPVAALTMATGAVAGSAAADGAGTWNGRGHVFPVRGPHWTRGFIGEFGAPRSGGRLHEGFDVVAACGTPLLAARGGKVVRKDYDGELDGNYVTIHAQGTGRNYVYSHLLKPARVTRGEIVRTGRRIGSVGKSGNARTVGCHLHFEMRVRGRPFNPEPALRRWDSFS